MAEGFLKTLWINTFSPAFPPLLHATLDVNTSLVITLPTLHALIGCTLIWPPEAVSPVSVGHAPCKSKSNTEKADEFSFAAKRKRIRMADRARTIEHPE